jgi:hypothetical protein
MRRINRTMFLAPPPSVKGWGNYDDTKCHKFKCRTCTVALHPPQERRSSVQIPPGCNIL